MSTSCGLPTAWSRPGQESQSRPRFAGDDCVLARSLLCTASLAIWTLALGRIDVPDLDDDVQLVPVIDKVALERWVCFKFGEKTKSLAAPSAWRVRGDGRIAWAIATPRWEALCSIFDPPAEFALKKCKCGLAQCWSAYARPPWARF